MNGVAAAKPTNQRTDPRVEASRRAIRAAALAELAAAGYEGFAIDSVARRAGVGRSTVYRHWRGKAELIADALESLNVQPNPAADVPEPSARAQVRTLLLHLVDALSDSEVSACLPALVHAAEHDDVVRRFHHGYAATRRQRLTDVIASGVASGELPDRLDPEAASLALAGAMFYRRLLTPAPPDVKLVDGLLDAVLGPG